MPNKQLPTNCPNCQSEMIEDAWEFIEVLPNGDIDQEIIYPAWVCSKFCGVYFNI